jgi:hypothetical protein
VYVFVFVLCWFPRCVSMLVCIAVGVTVVSSLLSLSQMPFVVVALCALLRVCAYFPSPCLIEVAD